MPLTCGAGRVRLPRRGAPQFGANHGELDRMPRRPVTSPRKILPKSGISMTWPKDLPGTARSTPSTNEHRTHPSFSELSIGVHPTVSVDYPSVGIPVATLSALDQFGSLFPASLLKKRPCNEAPSRRRYQQAGIQRGRSVATAQPESLETRTGERDFRISAVCRDVLPRLEPQSSPPSRLPECSILRPPR